MNTFLRCCVHSQRLFAACVAAYVAFIGPCLISAASTLAVGTGMAIAIGLLAWAVALFGRPHNQDK